MNIQNSFLLLTFLITIASCHDVIVGQNTDGRKIFDENRQASPAIWRQTENVTVNATDNEVISRVVITDLRSEKDGDVKIVEGGEGQKNVTIELKSPTVLRGYDFHIEVFTIPDKNHPVVAESNDNGQEKPDHPSLTRIQRQFEDIPKTNEDGLDFERPRTNLDGLPTTKLPEYSTKKSIPIPVALSAESTSQNRNTNVEPKSNVTTQEVLNNKPNFNPAYPVTIRNENTSPSTNVRNSRDTNETSDNEGRTDIPIISDNPRAIPSNRFNKQSENIPSVPGIVERDYNINNGQSRITRQTDKDNVSDNNNGQNTRLIPWSVGRNFENDTKISASSNKERNNLDTLNQPSLISFESKRLPQNDTKTNGDKRNTRDAQNEAKPNETTYKPSVIPSTIGKNKQNFTDSDSNKRITRDTQNQNESYQPRNIPPTLGRSTQNATNIPISSNNHKINVRDVKNGGKTDENIHQPTNIPSSISRTSQTTTNNPITQNNEKRAVRETLNQGDNKGNIYPPTFIPQDAGKTIGNTTKSSESQNNNKSEEKTNGNVYESGSLLFAFAKPSQNVPNKPTVSDSDGRIVRDAQNQHKTDENTYQPSRITSSIGRTLQNTTNDHIANNNDKRLVRDAQNQHESNGNINPQSFIPLNADKTAKNPTDKSEVYQPSYVPSTVAKSLQNASNKNTEKSNNERIARDVQNEAKKDSGTFEARSNEQHPRSSTAKDINAKNTPLSYDNKRTSRNTQNENKNDETIIPPNTNKGTEAPRNIPSSLKDQKTDDTRIIKSGLIRNARETQTERSKILPQIQTQSTTPKIFKNAPNVPRVSREAQVQPQQRQPLLQRQLNLEVEDTQSL